MSKPQQNMFTPITNRRNSENAKKKKTGKKKAGLSELTNLLG